MRAITEGLALIGTIDPDAYGTGITSTDVIDMLYWKEVLFVVQAGTITSTGTIDFEVNYDTASNGSFTNVVTGKAITQLTAAGTDSDKQALVRVTDEEVAAMAAGARYIRGDASLLAAGADFGVVVLGVPKHYGSAAEYDIASVDEIIP